MRIIVTGQSRSGRTTAARLIAAHLLRFSTWTNVLLLDGKGHQLEAFKSLPRVDYFDVDSTEAVAARLNSIADWSLERFRRENPERNLILADDIQDFTRHEKQGKVIKRALSKIAESQQLGDWLILTAPREPANIPPPVRHQAHSRIQTLGGGFFLITELGSEQQPGRLKRIEVPQLLHEAQQPIPSAALEDFELSSIISAPEIPPSRTPATLYLSEPGGGKTYALLENHQPESERILYLDLSEARNQMLKSIIERAGCRIPARTWSDELEAIAILAITTEPTLLLLDNLHLCSPKSLVTVERLMDAAANVALSANEPKTPAERRKLKKLMPRCEVKHIKALSKDEASQLLWSILDRNSLRKPEAVERKLLREASGNPGALTKLAHRIQRGDANELRSIESPVRRVPIDVLVIVIALIFVVYMRREFDGYMAAVLTVTMILLRPFLYKSIRHDDD